ncbi:MAG: hypothetical protein SAJ12_05545 [Jaaginema sp. PMC 1079.18]|nr:hypothetical protein [Jaaginema sp. PMC 1080.18]MEC4850455.1 hypothetical protein [Jaaginema sp. PMC 1079.18]MEC4867519.1 hypothetical protein [Jaaginema sp. PMC 1078.18]
MAVSTSTNPLTKAIPFLILGLCAATVVTLQLTRVRSRQSAQTPQDYQQQVQQQKIRLQFLQQLPSLGFDNLIADWTFLQYIQYFGDDEARAATGYELALDYLDLVLERDPRFLGAYNFLATAGSIYTAQPERTDAIIERGLQSVTPQVPQYSYYIWRQKGINELLFLPDAQANAQKSFLKAAEWASLYEDEQSQFVAEFSRQTAIFLETNPESKVAKVGAWALVLQNTSDELARDRAIEAILNLGGKVEITPEGQVLVSPPQQD